MDDADKIKVQQATDLVALIGEHVSLRSKGREFVGLCPFHDDQNPSMYVSPQKQIYKCFSCGAGGDAFSFVMGYHKMTFPEALNHLAERAGIELTRRRGSSEDPNQPSERQRIMEANEKALRFFRNVLAHETHGQAGQQYLQQRGISPEMIEAFGVGLAPDRWDGLSMKAEKSQWSVQDFMAAGLLSSRKSGPGSVDRFRHRLIFPISDSLGRPIAFGGRVLPNPSETKDDPTRDAKYLNSPESVAFDKSRSLYGLHLAKKAIIDAKTAIIVEGYTDVIACHQASVKNVVATLGTALTRGHADELRRYCEKVILVFDGDEAGQKAADRAVEIFLTAEVDVDIAVLPGGQDPAELLIAEGQAAEEGDQAEGRQAEGRQDWDQAIASAQSAMNYLLARTRNRLGDADSVTARQHVLESLIDELVRLGLGQAGPVRRGMLIESLSDMVALSSNELNTLIRQREATLSRRLNGLNNQAPEPNSGDSPDTAIHDADFVAQSDLRHTLLIGIARAERQLVGCLIRDAALFDRPLSDGHHLDERIVPNDLVTEPGRRLYAMIYDRLVDGNPPTLAELLGELAEKHDHDMIRVITDADAEVEAATAGQDDRLPDVLDAVVTTILRHREDQSFQDEKRRMAEAAATLSQSETDVASIERLLKQRANQPFAGRIPTVPR